jgi:GH43 family beta-xylosidase
LIRKPFYEAALLLLTISALCGCILVEKKETGMSNRKYTNPLGIDEIGDPYILRNRDGIYYCYATSWERGFKAWRSEDLVSWEPIGPVYTMNESSWGKGDFWAPEVSLVGERYYMFYSARWLDNDSLRVGLAVSDRPEGPFVDQENRPFFNFGYAAIDAHLFIDTDGRKYLYYSRDCSENIVEGRHESHIYVVELEDDLSAVRGEPLLLLRPDQEWEKRSREDWFWNEGPFVLKHDGRYIMTYSANFYADREYAVGYAVSDSPTGPFIKAPENPVLSAPDGNDRISGPGHNSFIRSPDDSELFMVYHVHTNPRIGGGDRSLSIDRAWFNKAGKLKVDGPTSSPQPAPR